MPPSRRLLSVAEQSCAASGKVSAERCANAAANAKAEFEEKAPRFPTREACQRIFSQAGCSLGFSGADGWAGKKSGIYFSPRQTGFLVILTGGDNMSVLPVTLGPPINFSPRSILARDLSVNPKSAHQARQHWQAAAAHGQSSGVYGVDKAPAGKGGEALPPRPPVDPNFDCAAVLEPNARDSADTGCYSCRRRAGGSRRF